MRPRTNPSRVPTDLLEAKQALVERQFRAAASISPHAWTAQLRVREAVQHSGHQLHAVGVGRKLVEGKPTRTLCVRLYVTQKLPRHLLAHASCLPEHIDGIPTDIVEAAPAYFAASPPCSLRKLREQRPARGGISGAHEAIQAATLAARCVSRRLEESMDRFVLGNCHTLADFGAAALGSSILQPSTNDGGTAIAHRLAGLHRFSPILESATGTNRIDAAVAKLDSASAMDPGICTLGTIQGTASATLGARVHKHGRTTGSTTGIVDDPSIDVLVPLSRQDPTRLAQFVDQLRIRPQPGQLVFAQPGDSGALVLNKGGNSAIGLLFACPDNGSYAYANPISAVLDALEIDLE